MRVSVKWDGMGCDGMRWDVIRKVHGEKLYFNSILLRSAEHCLVVWARWDRVGVTAKVWESSHVRAVRVALSPRRPCAVAALGTDGARAVDGGGLDEALRDTEARRDEEGWEEWEVVDVY